MPLTVKRRTQAVRSSATCEALLEAARETITKRGYAATMTAQTARRAAALVPPGVRRRQR